MDNSLLPNSRRRCFEFVDTFDVICECVNLIMLMLIACEVMITVSYMARNSSKTLKILFLYGLKS